MIECAEIDEYIQYMNDHPEWINKDRNRLIDKVVIPTLKRDDIYFDAKTYRNCIRYCEANYYPLFPYQKFIYAFVFMYRKSDDQPVFRKIFIMMGRGNGKDGMMAPLANFLQTPLYGVKGYNIELVANSEDQIKDTYKVPYDMLYGNPKFKGKFSVTKEKIINLETKSELKYNTSNSKTKDGKRPGCVFFNEIHAYENYDNINVYESAAGKVPQFREIIITTNGYVREGPLDDTLSTCEQILRTGENPLRIFPFICRLDSKKEAGDEMAMHKANPSMEYMPVLADAIRMDWLEAQQNASKLPEFLTKRCNLPEKKELEAVTSWNNILKCSYSDPDTKTLRASEDTTGQLAIIGIDYADVRDFASCGVLTIESDGSHKWRQHSWICSCSPFFNSIKFPIANIGQKGFEDYEVTDAPSLPADDIVRYCLNLMQQYAVQKITMDTYRYTIFKELFERSGITIESKDNPGGIVRLVRRVGSASAIIAPLISQLFADGKIDFGDSAIMRWYTNNTATQIGRYGNTQYVKIEPKLRKNDGFMAFVAAEFSSELLKEQVIYV
ncbi:MAG: terminase TerL endonuclease subunit [Lactimicrobium sp.]|jgi:phage terminase large subunit-like protein|uniref:terminase TerL endonuclease subunit n=1 Tax=Lactimicrobium sp. TaxID=2563780 RepID=UPI002F351B06